jgi:hypothetical protein
MPENPWVGAILAAAAILPSGANATETTGPSRCQFRAVRAEREAIGASLVAGQSVSFLLGGRVPDLTVMSRLALEAGKHETPGDISPGVRR